MWTNFICRPNAFILYGRGTSKAPPNKTLTTQTLDNIIIFKCSAWRSGFALIMTFVRTSLKTRLEMNITKYDNNQLHQGMWRRAESKRKQSSEDVESINPPFWDMIFVKKYENVFNFIYLVIKITTYKLNGYVVRQYKHWSRWCDREWPEKCIWSRSYEWTADKE